MWDRLANPAALNWLWLVPVLAVLTIVFTKRHWARVKKELGEKLSPFLLQSLSPRRRRWKRILELAAVTLFVFALARPQSGESRQKVKSEGVEIMLVMDVSQSMLADDVRPSRLELAKTEMEKFLELASGDRVGLVAFAGSAVTLSPLTADKSSIKMFIESLSTEAVSTQGTDFRKALLEAKSAFEQGGIESDQETAVARVVIVVSDGEDNEKGAVDAARELVKAGARIYSVAVGTERGATIPVRDRSGQIAGRLHDKKGKEVVTTLRKESLEKLAEEGEGAFYQLQFGGETAKQMKRDFDHLQKSIFDAADIASYDENYQVFLLLGIFFALGELVLTDWRRPGRIWRGRYEVKQQ